MTAPKGQQESQRSAQAREQDAFCEKLANHAHVARAQRSANGKLARAANRTRQQKVCDVRARNQQQEADGAQKQQKEW